MKPSHPRGEPTPRRLRDLIALLALGSCLSLTPGCSSSGDGDGGSSGTFLDSPVAGASYRRIGTTEFRMTDANGRFRYSGMDDIEFRVGDILLGQAAPAPVITPVDLVPGAMDETNNGVVARARFLQALDGQGVLGDGIQIPESVSMALMGQTLDFDSVDFETEATTLLQNAGAGPLPSVGEAQTHLAESLLRRKSGVYRGTFGGDVTGTWELLIDSRGGVTGGAIASGDDPQVDDPTALIGMFETDGLFSVEDPSSEVEFQGDVNGVVSGTWTNPPFQEDGTFAGARTNAGAIFLSPDVLSDVAGIYDVTVFFAGQAQGTVTVVVETDGHMRNQDVNDPVGFVITGERQVGGVSFVGRDIETTRITGQISDTGALSLNWSNAYYNESGTAVGSRRTP